jgi:hypothetical protein
MTVENAVRLLAGSLVLTGLVLGLLVSPWFFILVGFVGLNLMQSSVTHICPAESFFRKAGLRCAGEPRMDDAHRARGSA